MKGVTIREMKLIINNVFKLCRLEYIDKSFQQRGGGGSGEGINSSNGN